MASPHSKDHPTVYSSEFGRICPDCGEPVGRCSCKKQKSTGAGDGIVRVGRETRGRGGKTVTTISGISLDDEKLKVLASDLKRRCGTGGTIKDGIIEIQGEHRDVLMAELEKRGYRVKRGGG